MEKQIYFLVIIGLLVIFLLLAMSVLRQYRKNCKGDTPVVNHAEAIRDYDRILEAKKVKKPNRNVASVDLFEFKPYGSVLIPGDFDHMGVMYSGVSDD